MEKYNHKQATQQLASIMDAKRFPEVPMAREEFKEAVENNLPSANNADVADFNKFLYPERPANTPAEGLEKKMKYWKDKDTSVQERIMYAQSWNLATELVSNLFEKKDDNSVIGALEIWQKYFYKKLKEGDQNGK